MTQPDAGILRIRDGVFFTVPEPLPRGRHQLGRTEVLSRQRERMLIAMTELLAAKGVGAVGPAEVAKRAGVSLDAFYECFEGKEQCIFSGYDRFIGVLLERLLAADVEGQTRVELVDTLLGAYIETLQSDLVVARAYQMEIDTLGPEARARRRNSLQLFADYIREVAARKEPGGQPPAWIPRAAYVGMVYAARQLTSDALDLAAEPDLSGLREELRLWLVDTFRDR